MPPAPTSSRVSSNCGDEANDGTVLRVEHRHDRRDYEGEADEGDIEDREVDHFGHVIGAEVADIELLPADDAGIAAQLPDELIGADVEGVNFRRPVLQQAVGESAGAGADIHAGESGRMDAELRGAAPPRA